MHVPDMEKSEDLLTLFEKVKTRRCDIHYCGTLSKGHVEKQITENIRLDKIDKPSKALVERYCTTYDKPLVYLYDVPKSSQNYVLGYIPSDTLQSQKERVDATLLQRYLGGGMYSILFQEIREFRSLAYGVKATYVHHNWENKDHPGGMYFVLSTQCDKTLDAVNVLDSLLKDMPLREKSFQAAKNDYYNFIRNDYPSFRDISKYIADSRNAGYDEDNRQQIMDITQSTTIEDIETFYRQHIQGKPLVFGIVGDTRKIDMQKLANFGTIIKIHKSDVYK